MVHNFQTKEINRIRIACAIGVAVMAYMGSSGNSRALPIAPLPVDVTTDAGNIVPVYYYRGHYYPYRWHGGYYGHRYYRYGRYRYY